jgi:hypothetical protein
MVFNWYFGSLLCKFCDEEIVIISDGAPGQFKNRYIMKAMHELSKKWKANKMGVFAASHGKGAGDGVGGEVKRIVWDCVRSKNCHDFVFTSERMSK